MNAHRVLPLLALALGTSLPAWAAAPPAAPRLARPSAAANVPSHPAPRATMVTAPLYGFQCEPLEGGAKVPLSRYAGKVMLIVNTASKCGYTPQYEQLQALHAKLAPKGLAILGFPSNDFLMQEPGSNQDIAAFCTQNYGVTFPMFAKVQVKAGDRQAPLYRFLTEEATNPRFAGAIGWNFVKFLVDRKGQVVGRYPSNVRPDDPAFVKAIDALLTAR